MPAPSGVKVELEFTPGSGVFTDVTADVDYGTGIRITVGRTSPQSQAQVGTATVSLRNPTGKYTPGVAVLTDGTTAPYYPNIDVRRRLRISNSSGVRFLGQVKAWQPNTNGFAGSSMCDVSAADLMDSLSRVQMQSAIQVEVTADSPLYYWPLTDAAGSTAATEYNGKVSLPVIGQASGPITFGDNGPGSGDGSGVKFGPTAYNSGQILHRSVSTTLAGASTVELWFNRTAAASWVGTSDEFLCELGPVNIEFDSTGLHVTASFGTVDCPPATYIDGAWHHVVFVQDVGSCGVYIDGALVVSGPGVGLAVNGPVLRIGDSYSYGPGRFNGNIGQVAIYNTALSAARITAHYNAGSGWPGETTDERVARFLGYAGVSAANYTLDASSVVCGSYPQAGKDVLSGCQDMVTTEGGGSVFYTKADKLVFRNRDARTTTLDLTLTAEQDTSASGYSPSLDDQSLVNQVTAQRSTESGTQTEQTSTDAASVTAYGLASQSVTTYTQSDDDALNLAQSIVAAGSTPGWRMPQITVDLLTAQNNLYASLQNVGIGSRIRLTGLPTGQAPASQVDVYVEGWTETISVSTYSVTFDTSPADNPARFIWQDATYGDWQAQPDCALNTAITTSVATTVVIKSPTTPTFTTAGAAYPIKIQIGAEHITLNNAPGGSSSPQTFTGVTRGVDGTTASTHAINSPVTAWPATAWAL